MELKAWLYFRAVKLHLIHFSVSEIPYDPTVLKRWQAEAAITELGDAARPVLPDLITLAKATRDPEVRYAAQAALRRLAPEEYLKICSEGGRAGPF